MVIEIETYLDEYSNKIKPWLRDIIIDLQISDIWKTQFTIAIKKILKKSV